MGVSTGKDYVALQEPVRLEHGSQNGNRTEKARSKHRNGNMLGSLFSKWMLQECPPWPPVGCFEALPELLPESSISTCPQLGTLAQQMSESNARTFKQ